MRLLFFCLALSLTISSFSQPKYEFRAVWIATVDNIDWPQRGNTDPAAQRAEFIRQLDMHKKNGMNAVIVQVRPAADAFYPSPYEPWSQWLTGVQGKPPSPYYDPLSFMIEEAHKRGMEFHAWLNPYRANFNIRSASIAPNHITRIHPEWFLTYGTTKYFNPANKDAQQFVLNVVRDLVKRYPIDAVHMDDYFYPYRIAGKEFPDQVSYVNSGTTLSKDDWRRSNVDSIIKKLSIVIKEVKPFCKFGVSPFCVWRNADQDPEGSDTKAGQTNYDDLYADILLWLKEGWVDYVAPQLYLEIGHSRAAYEKLVDWWSKHSYGRHIYIGHGIYRAFEKNAAWKNPDELPDQIKLLRQYPTIQGSIYFSSKSFDSNPNGWNDSLRNNYYRTPALIPPMEWIKEENPDRPDSLAVSYFQGDIVKPIYSLTAYKSKEITDIRSMILYMSPKKEEVVNRSASALKFIISQNIKDNSIAFYGFSPSMYYKDKKKYFVASSFENQGGESDISNIITVIKKKNGSYTFE
jgi:uncharacterized lipoprotein YddW (UPF0748 family)